MVDLGTEAVQKHWHEFGDPMIFRVITFMESVESWTKDGNPEVEATLKTLGSKIAQLQNVDIADFGHEEDVINISCNIKTGRALRLLQAFDQIQPGTASKLLAYAEEITNGPSDPAGIFLRRNIVFERLRLIGRVFAAERFELILKSLEEE